MNDHYVDKGESDRLKEVGDGQYADDGRFVDSFLLFYTAPWCIQPVEIKKMQPQLLANVAVATNQTATVPQDRKQQKIARVNRYSVIPLFCILPYPGLVQ